MEFVITCCAGHRTERWAKLCCLTLKQEVAARQYGEWSAGRTIGSSGGVPGAIYTGASGRSVKLITRLHLTTKLTTRIALLTLLFVCFVRFPGAAGTDLSLDTFRAALTRVKTDVVFAFL